MTFSISTHFLQLTPGDPMPRDDYICGYGQKNYVIFFFAGLVLCWLVELSSTLEHKHSI